MMIRIAGILLFLVCAITLQANVHSSLDDTVAKLKKQRVDLLEERASFASASFELGKVSREFLAEARIDLLEAKLEYATDNATKKSLLEETIACFEKLIEIQEIRTQSPGLIGRRGDRPILHEEAHCDLLLLKAKRTQVQIALEMLEQA